MQADTEDKRPDPDRLLRKIQNDEKKERKGKLKIFLGMSAGVGKTWAMLKAAKEELGKGIDVVVGIVETHGRTEIAKLAGELPTILRSRIIHKEIALEEFDLDAVLERHPQLVLIDELAHTNAPGSRHSKRYLDVLEILDAGINVYTTVNIQHLESRIDVVKHITGITVHETVPDTFFDLADEVVLIDLSPDELINRLKEGKIYPEERIKIAEKNFFQKGNLTALREMALRLATERVDKQLRNYKQLHGIEDAWKSSNRLMVAIFASPYSDTLIRWTRRLADLMDATWVGVYVENSKPISDEEKGLLSKNMTLVHQLGGEVITTIDENTVDGIVRVAKQNNVTQIVVGKSQRGFIKNLLAGGSITNRLMRQTGDIDIYSVAPTKGQQRAFTKIKKSTESVFPWDEQGTVLAITLGAWALASFIEPLIGYAAVGIIFLMSVCVSGLLVSRVSVLIMALLFSLIHNFFFIPPLYNFSVSRPEDLMMLAMFFIAAATIGHLTTRLKAKEKGLRIRESRALALYELTKNLAGAQTLAEVATIAVTQMGKTLGQSTAIYLAADTSSPERLKLLPASTFGFHDKERVVAVWVFQNNRPAGRFTDTLSAADGYYLPLLGKEGPIGVIGVNINKQTSLEIDDLSLLQTFTHQISAALEREIFHERARELHLIEKTQKLYKTLLDSVSHELKTPLATIKGSASALLDSTIYANKIAVENLLGSILAGSSRLQRLVDNLLDMTRIESGMLKPKINAWSIADLISSLLTKLTQEIDKRTIEVNLPPISADIICDPILVEQALINIIHNALIYTPPNSKVEINAQQQDGFYKIDISDYGPGLPFNNPEQVFDKFYRATPTMPGGIGLGLSIAKSFIELQNGKITAANNAAGGAVFSVYLPVEAKNK